MTTVTESWRKLLQFQWQRTKQRPTLSSCSFFFNTYIPYFYSATSQNKSKLNLHVGCVVQVTPHHLHQQLNWAHEGYQILKQRYPPPSNLTYTQYFNIHFLDNINIFFFLEKNIQVYIPLLQVMPSNGQVSKLHSTSTSLTLALFMKVTPGPSCTHPVKSLPMTSPSLPDRSMPSRLDW